MKKLLTGIVIFFVLTGIVHAGDGPAVVSQELAKVTTSWNGAELPAYPAGTPEITILRIEIPAGTVLPRHKHPVINAGVLLQGELTVVTDEGDRLHLKAGESIVEVVDTWHYGMNEGADTAVIIVFYAGVAGVPVTVR